MLNKLFYKLWKFYQALYIVLCNPLYRLWNVSNGYNCFQTLNNVQNIDNFKTLIYYTAYLISYKTE